MPHGEVQFGLEVAMSGWGAIASQPTLLSTDAVTTERICSASSLEPHPAISQSTQVVLKVFQYIILAVLLNNSWLCWSYLFSTKLQSSGRGICINFLDNLFISKYIALTKKLVGRYNK